MPVAPGNGQAAKICNNMILGISMIAVSEAFLLAEKLGLDAQRLFDIPSKRSGQCWSMTSYCPVPGPVPSSPANRDYQPGFTAAMMLKDLKLAQDAAARANAATPLGAGAAELYVLFAGHGNCGQGFFRDHRVPAWPERMSGYIADLPNGTVYRCLKNCGSNAPANCMPEIVKIDGAPINLAFIVLFKPILDRCG